MNFSKPELYMWESCNFILKLCNTFHGMRAHFCIVTIQLQIKLK